ncbi:MAG: hypothetical protein AMXMBFR13_04190 [Phycisphaerae bacterium]
MIACKLFKVLKCFTLACAAAAAHAESWHRDFDDGTFQGLIEWDPNEIFGGIDEFTPTVVDGALRMDFNAVDSIGDPQDDSAVMYDPAVFGNASVKMLIKWSTNPIFASTDDDAEMNAGILLRLDVIAVRSYLLSINDAGYLQMYKTDGLSVVDLCPGGFLQDVEPYDVTMNHWLRFECEDNGAGALVLRGRSWPEGSEEPCTWQVFCVDANSPYPPGGIGLLANEDPPQGNGQYVDLDTISASRQFACSLPAEVCGNGADDDGDLRVDCADSDCAQAAGCASCPTIFADWDRDGDVDQEDFGAWQACYTGPGPVQVPLSADCSCFDRLPAGGDGDVDQDDFLAFSQCSRGPMLPADQACADDSE